MDIGKRINKRRKQLKLSAEDLAEKLGKNRATIYRYESNDIENMPTEILEPLAKVLRVTPAYLMGWETEKEMPMLTSAYNYLPTTLISAGLPFDVEGLTETDKIILPDAIMGKHAGNQDIYILRINGDSMDKVMPDESLIAVKPLELERICNGDIVVYSNGYDYSVKRYFKFDDTLVFRPESNNIEHGEHRYNINDDIKIHGKVVTYIVNLD